MTLCTVNRADLVYTAECTGEVLLVELRGLCQISRSAKVIQLEQVCAALSACNYDLRGVDVGEALQTAYTDAKPSAIAPCTRKIACLRG